MHSTPHLGSHQWCAPHLVCSTHHTFYSVLVSDLLPLSVLPTPLEREASDPGDTFFADPVGVEEVTEVAAFLSALSLLPSLTVLPLDVVGLSFDLKEDTVPVAVVSTLSMGVSGVTEENNSDTDRV